MSSVSSHLPRAYELSQQVRHISLTVDRLSHAWGQTDVYIVDVMANFMPGKTFQSGLPVQTKTAEKSVTVPFPGKWNQFKLWLAKKYQIIGLVFSGLAPEYYAQSQTMTVEITNTLCCNVVPCSNSWFGSSTVGEDLVMIHADQWLHTRPFNHTQLEEATMQLRRGVDYAWSRYQLVPPSAALTSAYMNLMEEFRKYD